MSPEPLARARLALDGLSVGDAWGERFFIHPLELREAVRARRLPPSPWRWTDDTAMAQTIVEVLRAEGTIREEALARAFGARFVAEPGRGYGGEARAILQCHAEGIDWRLASSAPFSGQGSKGNGGAMRAAPLGAWFADDVERLIAEARRSAVVTHFHPDGQAGAIAVALAAALAWNEPGAAPARVLDFVLAHTPASATRDGLARAATLGAIPSTDAAEALGAGQRVLSEDTVPVALWCAAHHADFVDALWATVAAAGDRDTTCAIVGALLALKQRAVPPAWLSSREPLTASIGSA